MNVTIKKQRLDFIFKWHNGEVLEDSLKSLSNDNTFKYMPYGGHEGFLFINENRECVLINEDGSLDVADIEVNPEFIELCKHRLSKTKKMTDTFIF